MNNKRIIKLQLFDVGFKYSRVYVMIVLDDGVEYLEETRDRLVRYCKSFSSNGAGGVFYFDNQVHFEMYDVDVKTLDGDFLKRLDDGGFIFVDQFGMPEEKVKKESVVKLGKTKERSEMVVTSLFPVEETFGTALDEQVPVKGKPTGENLTRAQKRNRIVDALSGAQAATEFMRGRGK